MAENPKTSSRKQINFRLSDEDFQKLTASALTMGMTPSAYAKSLAVKSQLVKPKFDHETGVQVNFALRRLGTNLNQLARKANFGDLSPLQAKQLGEIRKAVNDIWRQLS
ncbi:MobC family plasmid mobilization relaxosome protein [Lacticaseibacillus rhamnosus]|uniref:MobC family plasmid mobilization relaxosome protein n=1 Tax=Lacticaseibacillus rhamnosus TaxID=47715 RepID=UPI0007E1ABA8|nr:MobC family plasmid mobilization relaxosome protein [Lacticaseibacillus rhamnosus]OAU09704.1 mobilization protein [Lacticaseibacillus rhamnosus]